jgi:hypothetical protein
LNDYYGGGTHTVLLGDVNDDKMVNALDFALLKKYLLDNSQKINTENADMNSDGVINALDFAKLKQLILTK